MDFKFNCNSNVKVKLTEYGEQILRERHWKLYEITESNELYYAHPFNLNIDEDGYHVMQMWDLMQAFGNKMGMCYDLPFEMNIIMTQGESVVKAE